VSSATIGLIKQAYRLLFREHKTLETIREHFAAQCGPILPLELLNLLNFIEYQRNGKMGRGREAVRNAAPPVTKRAAA
jgi:UDP-N-acetylglucosamine acyltransferase